MAARDRLEGQRQSAVANQAFSIQNETNDDLMSQYQLALQQAQAEYTSKFNAWDAAWKKAAEEKASSLEWAKVDNQSSQFKEEMELKYKELAADIGISNRDFEEKRRQYDLEYEQGNKQTSFENAMDSLNTYVDMTGAIPNKDWLQAYGLDGLLGSKAGQKVTPYQAPKTSSSSSGRSSSGSSSGSSTGGTLTERQNAATSKILAEAKAALSQGYSAQQVRTGILEDYAELTAAGVDFKAVDDYISNYSPVADAAQARSNIDTFDFITSLFNAGSANPTASALVKALQDKILLTSR
jgi:hypothetical protein